MKKLLLSLILYTAIFTCRAQCFEKLVWSDEFNNSSLDTSKWSYQTGNGCPNLCGWGNNELEYYTDNASNIRTQNGNLVIEAKKETVGSSSFTSGKIIGLNKFSFTYGRVEAKMRMPLGRGLWPAFWMLRTDNQWPMTGEIDIMEYRGDQPAINRGTLHYGSAWPNNQWDGATYDAQQDLSLSFHTYAVEWEPDAIHWYFDDVLIKTETREPNSLNPPSTNNPWPWNKDFYIILNMAVGGWFTGTTNVNDVQLTKPTFEVDYVRVYKYDSVSVQTPFTNAFAIPTRVQAEDFDLGCGNVLYDTDAQNTGGLYRHTPVDIQTCTDSGGGYNIGWTLANEWTEYSLDAGPGGKYNLIARAASQDGGGKIRAEIDGKSVGIFDIQATGGWQVWKDYPLNNITIGPGMHTLRLYALTGGYNLNYVDFVSSATVGIHEAPVKNLQVIEMSENGIRIISLSPVKKASLYTVDGKEMPVFMDNGIIYANISRNKMYILKIITDEDIFVQKIIKP